MTEPIVPQALTNEELEKQILPETYQWALSNGLLMYPPDFQLTQAQIAPFTLYPTPIARKNFEEAIEVQQSFNELYAEISRDQGEHWLSQETEKLAHSDEGFTGKLWDLYKSVRNEGIAQKLRLGIFRSDYLIDKNIDQIKQVEFNTVSVSFVGFSTRVGEVHKYLNDSGAYGKSSYADKDIPVPTSVQEMTKSFADAFQKYDALNDEKKIILMVVQRGERNVFDQRIIEYSLQKDYGIRVIRMTFDDIKDRLTSDNTDKNRLFFKETGDEIAIVYYRTGYTTTDYQNEQDWEARKFLEKSYAIKAPDLLTQLSDDSELGNIGKKLAFDEPHRFVLKPQREGGGNNVYKEDIPSFLSTIGESKWDAYILMEIIDPLPYENNVIIRGNEIFKESIISELGIYGSILFDDEKIHFNRNSGWLLRSKFTTSNEGGVAAGFGCLDSVVMY
ncbi:Eukaryotic glutathione synthase, ATP binding domain [Nakaseomyces glabratus]